MLGNRREWEERVVLDPYRPDLAIVSAERWDAAFARLQSHNRPGSEHHRGERSPFLSFRHREVRDVWRADVRAATGPRRDLEEEPVVRLQQPAPTPPHDGGSGQLSYSKETVEPTLLGSVLSVLEETADPRRLGEQARSVVREPGDESL